MSENTSIFFFVKEKKGKGKAPPTRARIGRLWKLAGYRGKTTRGYSGSWHLGNVVNEFRREKALRMGHLPHHRSGPPGLRIWKVATEEPTRALRTVKAASRGLTIFKGEGGGKKKNGEKVPREGKEPRGKGQDDNKEGARQVRVKRIEKIGRASLIVRLTASPDRDLVNAAVMPFPQRQPAFVNELPSEVVPLLFAGQLL